MLDITPIVEAVITLLAIIISIVVIPYFKVKTNVQQRQNIANWVAIATNAAEQIYKGHGKGAEKKAYVIKWLKNHGLTVDEKQLDAMIEAAVYEMSHSFITSKSEAEDSEDETAGD